MSRNWTYKVVKRMTGINGELFDFPAAATFESEADARAYAEEFAREQGEAGVFARIAVVARRGNRTVATFYSMDYRPGWRRRVDVHGHIMVDWERA